MSVPVVPWPLWIIHYLIPDPIRADCWVWPIDDRFIPSQSELRIQRIKWTFWFFLLLKCAWPLEFMIRLRCCKIGTRTRSEVIWIKTSPNILHSQLPRTFRGLFRTTPVRLVSIASVCIVLGKILFFDQIWLFSLIACGLEFRKILKGRSTFATQW